MKSALPFHRRNNNTSAPPETLTEEEKIVRLGGMIPTYPPEDGRNEGMPSKNNGGDKTTPYQQGKGEQSWEQRFQEIQQELNHMKEAVKG